MADGDTAILNWEEWNRKVEDSHARVWRHEWREKVPLRTGYVCMNCRAEVATAREMQTAARCTSNEWVPKDWLPQGASDG